MYLTPTCSFMLSGHCSTCMLRISPNWIVKSDDRDLKEIGKKGNVVKGTEEKRTEENEFRKNIFGISSECYTLETSTVRSSLAISTASSLKKLSIHKSQPFFLKLHIFSVKLRHPITLPNYITAEISA